MSQNAAFPDSVNMPYYTSTLTQIKLKEPVWLQKRSHCSVINLAHVGDTKLRELLRELIAEGAIQSYGSLSSLKSPLSFVCAGYIPKSDSGYIT